MPPVRRRVRLRVRLVRLGLGAGPTAGVTVTVTVTTSVGPGAQRLPVPAAPARGSLAGRQCGRAGPRLQANYILLVIILNHSFKFISNINASTLKLDS